MALNHFIDHYATCLSAWQDLKFTQSQVYLMFKSLELLPQTPIDNLRIEWGTFRLNNY